ncbi:MAG: hypothetical protein ACXVCF_20690 [Isosphaeraceae bacterium]
MGEIVEGMIHGKTIEIAVDPGLQDGGVVEVVNRRSNNRERGALLIFSSWKSLTLQSKRENHPCLKEPSQFRHPSRKARPNCICP